MSKNSERKSKIFAFICKQPNQTAKRSEILKAFEHWSDQHEKIVDLLLYQMLQKGKIKKVSQGVYTKGTETENQSTLF